MSNTAMLTNMAVLLLRDHICYKVCSCSRTIHGLKHVFGIAMPALENASMD